MAGSSAPLLNLQEIQFVPRYMVAKTRGGAGYKMTLGKAGKMSLPLTETGHSCHKLFSVAAVIFDCQERSRGPNVCALQ
jgi:hypothetical protein